jgi:hypothetical protein
MATESVAITLFEYMLFMVWTCISETLSKCKNPIFDLILPTQDVLEKLMSDTMLESPPVFSISCRHPLRRL